MQREANDRCAIDSKLIWQRPSYSMAQISCLHPPCVIPSTIWGRRQRPKRQEQPP